MRYVLVAFVAFLSYSIFDYFTSLKVIEANIVGISTSPDNPNLRQLHISIVSTFPEHAYIPDRVRRFFYLQPMLCLRKKDGSELINDEVHSRCFSEDDASASRDKKHGLEKSNFSIPFFLGQTPYNGKRLFFKSMVQEKGLWVQFQLQGYIIVPTVEADTVFLSLEPYCKKAGEQCKQIFGWP